MDSGVTENPGAETGQRVNALVAGLRKELRDARDMANRYVLEAATLRLKLREAERQATAGVTLARYCGTIRWNNREANIGDWPAGLAERIDAVLGRSLDRTAGVDARGG
jgi:hypothetical protein